MTQGNDGAYGDAEFFDVVDADDRVIDCMPRALVHARGLRHRAVHVFVFDRAGRLYVQRRSWAKDCSPGCWDTSAAGHVGSGETYASAAVRELAEELGISVEGDLNVHFKLEASIATGQEFVWVYSTITDLPVRPDPVEIIDGRWCTRDELDSWLARESDAFTAAFRLLWSRLQSG